MSIPTLGVEMASGFRVVLRVLALRGQPVLTNDGAASSCHSCNTTDFNALAV